MGPKPQVFKAPDGTEFSNRAEWRDYMMANYYSYKNKKNIKDVLIKKPGDIDGQVFDIAECENCTLVILDTCEQVQIDQVKNCKIFIGACTSSIFIRNCTDCIFYTCCRQLRLREVTSSSFYIYSMAEVHIEYSNTLQFAPFNGGYPEQAQHFQSAKLDPNHNLWYDIFDHNDPNKTHSNWSLMPENEYEEPWFPSTKCNPAVPRSKPGSVAKFEEKDEIQAFGVQQMISDAIQQGNEVVPPKLASPPKASPPKASPPKASPPKAVANANKKLDEKKEEKVGNEISLEVSLLIASAIAKNIDVSTWFNEGGFKGKLPVLDFNTKLISLSLIVGMEEDWETKRELEVAVSSVSLKTIQHLCSSGVDKAKKPYIDVTKFITLCKTKLAEEMGEEFDDSDNINKVDDTIVEDIIVEDNDIDINIDDIPVPLGISSEEIVEKYANIGLNTNNQDDDDDAAPARPSTARGSRTATRSEFESTGRPKSAPTTSRSSTSNKRPVDATQVDVNNLTPTKKVFAESLTLPDSPFDEEVVFNVEDEDDVDTAVGGVISKSKARTLPKSSSLKPNTVRSKPIVSAPTKSATKAPVQSKPVRTASAGPLRPTKHEHEPLVSARASRSMTRPATSSSINRPVSTQSSSFTRTSVSRPRPSSADPAQRYNRTSIGTSIASQPFHSTASIYSQKSISTEDQLVHFEKLVEDKVRQNVKQADSYHTIQVHLGFISDYTMVPHRGIAVTSSPRAWLSIKEIQAAFQAAYLRLPDAHMYALMRLVNKYAKTVRDTEPTGITDDAVRTSVSNNPNSTVLSHSKISADWFKKYLVDLRLCKTPSSTRRSLSASIIRNNDNNDGDHNQEIEKPLAWEDWLGKKIVDQKRVSMEKPKEFKNALSGQAHGLTKEEINAMLMKHDIIPSDIFNTEIALKIKSWILDAAGRRDFSHAFNVELKKEQTENKAAWAVVENRKAIATKIRSRLIAKKEASLRKAEEDKAEITKSLYWDYCKATKGFAPIPWGDWLKKHQEELKESLVKLEKEIGERQRAGIFKKQRLQTVAPLNLVEQKLKEAADSMSIDHGIELRKSIVALRKSAKELGISKGTLITKELFDKHLEAVLAPRLAELPEDIKPLAKEARLSHISKAFLDETGLDSLFTYSKAEAEQKVIAIDTQKKEEEGSKFNEWLDKKKMLKEQQLEKEKTKKEQLEKEAKEKKRRADIAYKKWVNLRRNNKYVSKVDKKTHEVPQPNKVVHKIRWNKDVEILADM